MALISCPTCGKMFEPEESEAMPFCSVRCRQVDLGRWLDERYSIPLERIEDESDETGQPPDED
jgi:uncharacterized protein